MSSVLQKICAKAITEQILMPWLFTNMPTLQQLGMSKSLKHREFFIEKRCCEQVFCLDVGFVSCCFRFPSSPFTIFYDDWCWNRLELFWLVDDGGDSVFFVWEKKGIPEKIAQESPVMMLFLAWKTKCTLPLANTCFVWFKISFSMSFTQVTSIVSYILCFFLCCRGFLVKPCNVLLLTISSFKNPNIG